MRVLLIFVIAVQLLFGAKGFNDIKVHEVTSIYDGDTFRVNIKDYPDIVGKKMAIRINGIDTPEMKGKCQKEKLLARKAKKHTVNFLRSCDNVILKNPKRGKYFRIVADVYCADTSLAQSLILNNLGVEYYGGKKVKNWCE